MMNELRDRNNTSSGINITRNNFLIQGLELGADINKILSGNIPSVLACDFIHEIAHYWCFTTQVGGAMAVLRHRARLTMMENPNDEANINKMLKEEVLWHCARAALDPIAEGLAMFAELDVYPGHVTNSPIFWWLSRMFLFPKVVQEVFYNETEHLDPVLREKAISQWRNSKTKSLEVNRALDTAYSKLLYTNRESNAIRLVRENLLSQPLSLKGRGHYLLGYMLVKRVARRLRRAIGSTAEQVIILEWIKGYFFDDAQLVLMLIGKERVESTTELIARIDSRIDALFDEQAIELFKAFAKDRAGRDSSEVTQELMDSTAPALGLDKSEAAAALATLLEAIKQLSLSPGVDKFDAYTAVWAINMREMSLIGKLDGMTSVFPSGAIRFNYPNGGTLHTGIDGIMPGDGPGSLYLFFSQGYGLCWIVTRNLEVVSCFFNSSGQFTRTPIKTFGDLKQIMFSCLMMYPESDHRLRKLDEWYHNLLETISPRLGAVIRDQTCAELERIYRRAALGEAPLSRHHDLSQSMQEAGFFSLINFDLELFRNLVALGLPGAKQVPLENAEAIMAKGKAAGLPLVEKVDQYLIASF